MATATGKIRTAAAFIKRLFEVAIVTRVLFLVDRISALSTHGSRIRLFALEDFPSRRSPAPVIHALIHTQFSHFASQREYF